MKRLASILGLLAALWAGQAALDRAEAAPCVLPYVLQNGTLPDATQVMADFYALLNCINTGAAGLPSCSAVAAGLVPATGGGTSNFLRADCTFVPPPTAGACASATAGLVPATGGGTANFLRADCTFAAPPGTTGTVTSVDATVPVEFAVGGVPFTTSGTIAITKATETANTVWAGPTTGGAAQPTFRGLVAADLPACPSTGNYGCLNRNQSWTAGNAVTPVALTDAATITVNAALGNIFTVTLAGNRTLGNPSGLLAGQTMLFAVTQDGTGSRTLAYGTDYGWAGGTPPTLTTTAGHKDIINCWADTNATLNCAASLDVHH